MNVDGSTAAPYCGDAGSDTSYPGGKSGSGIYQRLINQIPPHRVLISAFAGHCGVVRNIRPAEHTIIIDQEETVCQWWDDWSRTKQGRAIAIHHCSSIEWLRFKFNLTGYPAARSDGTRVPLDIAAGASDARSDGAAATRIMEHFIFADPPYILGKRTGKQYKYELSDNQHRELLEILTQINAASAGIMLCGYPSEIYQPVNHWRTIEHRVPTRGGPQDEKIWLNYHQPTELHDYRYIGHDRRNRERIRRRQRNWIAQLESMSDQERNDRHYQP